MMVVAHRLGAERSIAMHRLVADRLAAEPGILNGAGARVERWLATGEVDARYAREWRWLLAWPLDDL